MTLDEAKAWASNQRSCCSHIVTDPIETHTERIARADAAMLEQAYWILRMDAEGLLATPVPEAAPRDPCCDNEWRTMNGDCMNCGAPSL